jgi:hypothetical protein
MADMTTPNVSTDELPFKQLRQVTVELDERIEEVNHLLADGWKLITIGYTAQATVYVLGRTEEKPRRGTGFVPNDRPGAS